ncbi:hypothetical protein [Deinococcus sonorensis]|uniref:ANTAR domain-containing protein n=2 Tax=Deinococcus sonorensis TaxID=309891 RepID=A0AAU7UGE2_9DEIO
MNETEDALCDRLSGLGLGSAAVARQGKEHGLSLVQTMRLVVRVCGATFREATDAATQAHYGMSIDDYATPLNADALIAAETVEDAATEHDR